MWIVDGCWRQDNNDLIFDMACAAIINSADLHLFSSHWRARSPHLFDFFLFLDGGLNEMEFNSWRIQKDISAGGDYWEISRNSPEEISNIILLHLPVYAKRIQEGSHPGWEFRILLSSQWPPVNTRQVQLNSRISSFPSPTKQKNKHPLWGSLWRRSGS